MCWDKAKDKWRAHIRVSGKRRHLGYFADEEEAAAAYRKAIAQGSALPARPAPAEPSSLAEG